MDFIYPKVLSITFPAIEGLIFMSSSNIKAYTVVAIHCDGTSNLYKELEIFHNLQIQHPQEHCTL